ncbi:MAG: tetratricopeptide repeat protein, partial [Acidimicrobiales bacterium]|nr:tetratricopeptide repeat protein [Acidimicrobiales bacterium]
TPNFHWALPVRESGSALEEIVVPPLTRPTAIQTLRIDATAGLDTPARFHFEVLYRGDEATALRQALANAPREEFLKMLSERAGADRGGGEVAKTDIVVDEATGDVRLLLDGAVSMGWQRNEDTGLREYGPDLSRLGSNFDYKRDPGPDLAAPYAIAFPAFEQTVQIIQLPQGAKGFTVGGEDVDQSVAGMAFKRVSRIENGVFTQTSSSRSLQSEFPSSQLAANKLALRELWDMSVQIKAPKSYRDGDAELALRLDRTPITTIEYRNRAEAWREKGDKQKALADYDAAVQLKADDADSLNGRCWMRARLNLMLEGALADCNAALDAEPTSADVLHSRGFVYLRLGRPEKAIADLNQALKNQADFADALYVRGLARRQVGDAKGADQDIAAARKLFPEVIKTYKGYGL